MLTINNISNIQLNYAREPQFSYGSKGRPATFQIQDEFHDELVQCFNEIIHECPLGKPNIITCAGIYVDKPNSHHRHGTAFDLDACFWDDYNFITNNFLHDHELYLGIESFLRKHFGIVLNYFYNNSHKDHFHIDNSTATIFSTNQRSKVLYVQLVLNYIYKHHVEVDGIWGPQTTGAINEVLRLLGLTGKITTKKTWMSFLTKTGRLAFAQFDKNKNPKRLLNNVYAILLDSPMNITDRISILSALNDFKNHKDTEDWLDSYSEKIVVSELVKQIV